MKKSVKWTGIVLGIAAVGWLSDLGRRTAEGNRIGLTGSVRSDFLQAVGDTCLKSIKSDPANKDLPVETVDKYCKCYVSRLADRLSVNDVRSLNGKSKDDAMTLMHSQIDDATKICLEEIRRG